MFCRPEAIRLLPCSGEAQTFLTGEVHPSQCCSVPAFAERRMCGPVSRKAFSLLLSAPAALNSDVLYSILNLLLCWGIEELLWILLCVFLGVGVSGNLHVCGVCSHVHPPQDQRFYSGNPNIVPCDQVLTKKSSNPYLGQVQGLEFLIALLPGSAACAVLNTSGESRSLLLMV